AIILQLKKQDFSYLESYTPKIRETIESFLTKNTNDKTLKIFLTGNAAFSYDMNTISEKQGKEAELRVLFLTFIVLIFAFRSITASIIALISGFSATIITISLLKILTIYFNLSIFCQNVSTMLGLALSIDYSLLLITRYRQELLTSNKNIALKTTVETAGLSVINSGTAVLIGFCALFIPNLNLTNSIAMGGVIVVLFSVLAAISLTPIMLYLLTDKLDYPLFLSNFKPFKHKFNFKWSYFIIKNSLWTTIIALIILLLCSLPIINLKLSDPEIRIMPDYMESKQGFIELQKISKADITFPIFILAKTTNGMITDSNNLINISEYTSKIKKDPRISNIYSLVDFSNNFNLANYLLVYSSNLNIPELETLKKYLVSDDKTLTLIQVFTNKNLKSFEVNNLITDLRKVTANKLKVEVGGPASISHDLIDKLYSSSIYIILCTYFVTFILLAYIFKSIFIPLKAIFVNTISLLASYGILIMIFQYSWGARFINLKYSPESLLSGIPIILFCIMFSLSMDYEVFLLSRIYESYQKNKDNDQAIIEGLDQTSGVITKAALIMLIVFLAFIQADIILIKMLGTGLAIAIFIDATLIRMIVVPGIMKVSGKLNWYFPFKK
ncbi:MAG: MMPL family transporter, partial [Candidatus Sericytochromatia bacterium]|nr:MMPL family transporter [Candidatus Sericytochromatia bacterium]